MTDDDVTAINRLGGRVPYKKSVTPLVGADSGEPYCRICIRFRVRLPPYRSCASCGQMYHWNYVHETAAWLRTQRPPVSDREAEYLRNEGWERKSTRKLVSLSLAVTKLELHRVDEKFESSMGFAPDERSRRALLRQLATEELDRRSRRGIEDE